MKRTGCAWVPAGKDCQSGTARSADVETESLLECDYSAPAGAEDCSNTRDRGRLSLGERCFLFRSLAEKDNGLDIALANFFFAWGLESGFLASQLAFRRGNFGSKVRGYPAPKVHIARRRMWL
jgi:hypothetical protein